MPSLLLAALGALVGCGVEQPAGFCSDSTECGDGRVCNAYTRTCQLDVSQPLAGYDIWGTFTCVERDQVKDAEGAMVLGISPSLTKALGLEITEGYTVGYYSARCGLGHSQSTARWILGTSIKNTSAVSYIIQLFVDDANLHSGGVQRGTSGNNVGFGIANAADNRVLLTSRDVEIRIDRRYADSTPRGASGEFRVRQVKQ